jgi:hypothetical protein
MTDRFAATVQSGQVCKPIVLLSLLVLALLSPAASFAQGIRSGEATLTVCNKGQIPINVVRATGATQLFSHDIDVVAWTHIDPGGCYQVYSGVGDPNTGSGTARSYIGFGFYNSLGQLIAGHAAHLPDFDIIDFGTPVLAPANERFCVRATGVRYRIAEHAALDCTAFRSGANDPGGYSSFTTTLQIIPRPMKCNFSNGGVANCLFGDYFLDVTATPASDEIRITGRIGQEQQPDQSTGSSVANQVTQQLATAAAEQGRRLAEEQAAAQAESKAWAEASVRGSVCVPDELLAEWNNPPPAGKMELLKRQLTDSLRERAKLRGYDQTKWFTVDSSSYSAWSPPRAFQAAGVVAATAGGSCASGHHEFLSLTP